MFTALFKSAFMTFPVQGHLNKPRLICFVNDPIQLKQSPEALIFWFFDI
jgi:hypothetical protein